MIEQDEEIINILEEIDYLFSQINKTLKSLKEKCVYLESNTDIILSNNKPLFNFFTINLPERKTEPQIVSFTEESQSLIKPITPINPFKFNNKTVDFDPQLLPSNFTDLEDIKVVCSFIKGRKRILKNELYFYFKNISKELIDIYLDVLNRKRFILMEGDYLIG
ncbi:hypothetical protein TUBRATIS_13320 [Tubulinosema ratisbonensis]|uniref:Uncharacterized protein n=1 Tax=Tubulinosema ratisbonensis TaxID=291195 RepID=A0A437AM12_9MICR|nr:hypothetical protein TUBRATIS_13320 [Tubulinosema ratisbonensis]